MLGSLLIAISLISLHFASRNMYRAIHRHLAVCGEPKTKALMLTWGWSEAKATRAINKAIKLYGEPQWRN